MRETFPHPTPHPPPNPPPPPQKKETTFSNGPSLTIYIVKLKFELENKMVCTILFWKLQKMWARGAPNAVLAIKFKIMGTVA